MKIAVVEDNPTNRAVLLGILSRMAGVDVVGFADPVLGLEACRTQTFDLVFVDYMMPTMDGVSFIRQFRALEGDTQVGLVMITADRDRDLRLAAIAAGATDFLNKPVDPEELKLRARNLLALRQAQLVLADRARLLAAEVDRATERLLRQEEELIWRLARAIEYRDGETGEHIARVATVSRIIAREYGCAPDFQRTIYRAAPLHDVGKIAISDTILKKPGRLDPDEMAEIRRHPEIGMAILADGEGDLIAMAASIAGGHHERWDGKGYPNGLAGAAIPLAARIVAVADVFDALASDRPYKKAWLFADACDRILADAGTFFDPACVAAFTRGLNEITALYQPHPQAAQIA